MQVWLPKIGGNRQSHWRVSIKWLHSRDPAYRAARGHGPGLAQTILRQAHFYWRGGGYITLSESKTKMKGGVYYLSCVSNKVGSPNPFPSLRKTKRPSRRCTFWTITVLKHKPFPSELLLLLCCRCTCTFRVASGTPGASAVITGKGSRTAFCLFSCYAVLKCNFLFMHC